MNEDLDKVEEELKKKAERRKEQKKSGRSVFKLQGIIKEKGEKESPEKNSKQKTTS